MWVYTLLTCPFRESPRFTRCKRALYTEHVNQFTRCNTVYISTSLQTLYAAPLMVTHDLHAVYPRCRTFTRRKQLVCPVVVTDMACDVSRHSCVVAIDQRHACHHLRATAEAPASQLGSPLREQGGGFTPRV
jgi:hypothetical protein